MNDSNWRDKLTSLIFEEVVRHNPPLDSCLQQLQRVRQSVSSDYRDRFSQNHNTIGDRINNDEEEPSNSEHERNSQLGAGDNVTQCNFVNKIKTFSDHDADTGDSLDLTLQLADGQLRVHKLILVHASTYFK